MPVQQILDAQETTTTERPEPAAGQWWTCTVDERETYHDAPTPGERVLIVAVDNADRVHIHHGRSSFSYEPDEWLAKFRFDPKGHEKFIDQFSAIVQQTAVDEAAIEQTVQALQETAGNPAKLLGGSPTGLEVPDTGEVEVALARLPRKTLIAKTHERAKAVRLALKRYTQRVQKQTEQLVHLVDQHRELLDARVRGLTGMVAKAEEAVWTLNLYLGKDEKIHRLLRGDPPPDDTRITIRQLVLYMDEECAIAAESGGIDAQGIPDFDTWIRDPAHLAQVLPEPRGVVAIKPRRTDKDYRTGNAFIEHKLNEQNKVTYWLIRNGGSLYRIWTELPVDEVIVPRAGEIEKIMDGDPIWGTKQIPPRPGTSEWQEAMQKAGKRKRHYMRILLFLQGLIDRTKVFWPLPGDRINIMKERVHAEYVDYVYDGEPSKLLPTGKPDFRAWLSDLHNRTEVGQRIVGAFPYFSSRDDRRVSPRGAGQPDSLALYSIESSRRGSLQFLFQREGTIWTRNRWTGRHTEKAPSKRASYQLDRSDSFWLNFDLADPADMRFYLQDRINRHHYAEMFPVLKAALAAKAKEAEEEAPFRRLLANEIFKLGLCSMQESEEQTALLVSWWKFKTRTHRALLSDDAKALRMILREFTRRWNQTHDGTDHEAFLRAILADEPDVLLVEYAGDGTYVYYVPENAENLFVRRVTLEHRGAQKRQELRWTVLASRLQSNLVLWASLRSRNWPPDLRRNDYLSDPEIEEGHKLVAAYATDHIATEQHYHRAPVRAVAVAVTGARLFHLFTARLPQAKPAADDGYGNRLDLDEYRFTLAGPAGKRQLVYRSNYGWHPSPPPWAGMHVLELDNEAIELVTKHAAAEAQQARRTRDFADQAAYVVGQVHTAQVQQNQDNARKAYLVEYGSDDTFDEEHKGTDWSRNVHYSDRTRRAAYLVAENGLDPNGWTLATLFEEARKLGYKDSKEDKGDVHNSSSGLRLPLDLVLHFKDGNREDTEADEDDDDDDEWPSTTIDDDDAADDATDVEEDLED